MELLLPSDGLTDSRTDARSRSSDTGRGFMSGSSLARFAAGLQVGSWLQRLELAPNRSGGPFGVDSLPSTGLAQDQAGLCFGQPPKLVEPGGVGQLRQVPPAIGSR